MVHKTLCSNFVNEITLIYYIYPRTMTEMNVSATVGEMSATVGKLNMVQEI